MSDELVLESPAIGWSRAEQVRRLGWRAMLASVSVAALAFAVGVPIDSMTPGWVCLFAILAAIVSGGVTAGAGLFGGARRSGRLTISGGRIGVLMERGSRNVAVTDVEGGWVEEPVGIRLRMRDGSVLAVQAPDTETAEAVLRAVGVSVQQRVLDVPLTSAASRTFLGAPIAAAVTAVSGLATVFVFGMIGAGVADFLRHRAGVAVVTLWIMSLMLAGVIGVLLAAVASLRGKRVAIGVDGVSIEGMLGKRFVSYDDVTRVDPDVHGVRLGLRTKGDVLLPTWRRGDPPLALGEAHVNDGARRQRVIFDRIRRAAALRRPGGPELAVLDRGGRSLEAWRDEVRALAKAPADYRRVQLAPHDLEELVIDGAAPAERRIAAVMALAAEDRPAARQRVRIAIDTCADEELKAALEQAAEGEIDELTVRKALRPG
jgi:hypothetical protein